MATKDWRNAPDSPVAARTSHDQPAECRGNFGLVELETPYKQWFTQSGQPTAHFTHARHQLTEWRDWLSRPENQQIFYDTFEIPDFDRRYRVFKPCYVLVYGRRNELEAKPHLNRFRAQQRRDDEVIMTFDRPSPEPKARQLACVARRANGYEAISVPATFRVGPNVARDLYQIRGLAEAVQKNPWISDERRRFLLERLPYWDQWVRDCDGMEIISTNDWE